MPPGRGSGVMPDVAIWSESGPGVGLGHIARCGTLASALQRRGVTVRLFTGAPEGVQFARELGVSAAMADRISIVGDQNVPLAIVDSYRVSSEDLESLRVRGVMTVVFDDGGTTPLPGDVVVNGAPGADQRGDDREPGRRYLLGPSYFALRGAFVNAPAKTVAETIAAVLVTVGGEDEHRRLPHLARIAAAAFPQARIIVVARGAEPSGDGWPERCDVRHAPSNYPELVRQADVIICGGGQSLIEAAAVGTPAAALLLGNDQCRQRGAMIAAGAAADGGDWRTTNADAELWGALESLRDAGSRARMSARGRALVDGRGADRLAAEILDAWQER